MFVTIIGWVNTCSVFSFFLNWSLSAFNFCPSVWYSKFAPSTSSRRRMYTLSCRSICLAQIIAPKYIVEEQGNNKIGGRVTRYRRKITQLAHDACLRVFVLGFIFVMQGLYIFFYMPNQLCLVPLNGFPNLKE